MKGSHREWDCVIDGSRGERGGRGSLQSPWHVRSPAARRWHTRLEFQPSTLRLLFFHFAEAWASWPAEILISVPGGNVLLGHGLCCSQICPGCKCAVSRSGSSPSVLTRGTVDRKNEADSQTRLWDGKNSFRFWWGLTNSSSKSRVNLISHQPL